MAAGQKKGRKFGRHRDRNPSSRLQAQRTNRNKARRIAAAPKGSVGHVCPKRNTVDTPLERAIMGHLAPNMVARKKEGRVIHFKATPIYVKGYFVDYSYTQV